MKPSTSRRFAAAVLAAAFAAGPMTVTLPALAAEGSVEVTNATEGTYKIYQLFTGTFSNNKMGDIEINSTYKTALVTALKKADSSFTLDTSLSEDAQASAIAAAIQGLSATSLQALANDLAPLLTGTAYATATSSSGTVSFGNVPEGYYIIISDASNQVKTSAIMLPVTSAGQSVEIKTTLPTITKTVDREDSGITNDAVNAPTYTIVGTVASNIADYSTYSYSFTDTLPAGLTTTTDEVKTKWNVSIKAGDTDLTNSFTTTVTGGNVITWSTSDLKNILPSVDASTTITLKYTPIYDDADIAALYGAKSTAPLINTVVLTYSNNPYTGSDGETDNTPSDDAQVDTYNLVIKKVDTNDAVLTGAKFTLTCEGTSEGHLITEDANGEFVFTGLERGKTYTITETTVPSGYKRIDPITFTIEDAENNTKIFTEKTDPSNAATWSTSADSRTGTVTIINVEGVQMPFTGEAGMIGGLVVGGLILTFSAAAAFRRKEEKE